MTYHLPVLGEETARVLAGASRVLDGTLGGGGHAELMLSAGADVTGIDRDPEALSAAAEHLAVAREGGRFRAFLGSFDALDEIPELDSATFNGILLDLGVSSRQLDADTRGFTFREGAPLDMRMGPATPATGAEYLADTSQEELARVFREYGDEPKARKLAAEIVRRRERASLETSDDLVNAIRAVLGARSGPGDFSRIFQAVRIAVNDELDTLERALPALRDRLESQGVLAVIAYHSGEDRIVKNVMRDWSRDCICPPHQPVCTCRGRALGTLLTRKAIMASDDEIGRNSRSRSARLRAWRKA